ncbi:hypothetical protein [uncultured Thiocystis sp.]|jgi:hypothetical protein|uniref:hypothetical protein n=1 Tax=uncultured Thiocystis sp. TaxID=1202134 RepID=UPI0025FCF99D|nr:hypothetical protein [uncultured Thiocystis sp.]
MHRTQPINPITVDILLKIDDFSKRHGRKYGGRSRDAIDRRWAEPRRCIAVYNPDTFIRVSIGLRIPSPMAMGCKHPGQTPLFCLLRAGNKHFPVQTLLLETKGWL